MQQPAHRPVQLSAVTGVWATESLGQRAVPHKAMQPIEVDQLPKTVDSSGLGKGFSSRGSRAHSLFADAVARTAVRCGLLILTW